MTYDLRRLRLKGLIARVPHCHRYVLTPLGRRVAVFMSKSYARLVRLLLDRLDPKLPDDIDDRLRRACTIANEHSTPLSLKPGLLRNQWLSTNLTQPVTIMKEQGS